jgi:predicted Zn finger-like uncharacterized protein
MSMVTSCPACATTFRVRQEQLTARHGKVRCGKCDEIFDAYKTLASYPDEPLPESPAPAVAEAQGARSDEPVPVQAMLDIDDTGGATLASIGATRAAQNPRTATALRIAVALLAVALLLQLLYALRAPLATAMPSLRPLLEGMCAIAGCAVPLPRKTDALAIESSDLQVDPQRPGVIVLTAALRNRGATAVQMPALELTLTNAQDQPIARRILLPNDYLERAAEAANGLRASAEINVRIELAIGELKAAGYRLYLFYL